MLRNSFLKISKVLIQTFHKIFVSRTGSFKVFYTEGKMCCDLLVRVTCRAPTHPDCRSVTHQQITGGVGRVTDLEEGPALALAQAALWG